MSRLTRRVVDEVSELSPDAYMRFWVQEVKRYERINGELDPPPSGLSDGEEKAYDKYAVAKRFLMDEGYWNDEKLAECMEG